MTLEVSDLARLKMSAASARHPSVKNRLQSRFEILHTKKFDFRFILSGILTISQKTKITQSWHVHMQGGHVMGFPSRLQCSCTLFICEGAVLT